MGNIIDRLRQIRKGTMFILSAPSGTGKSAVSKELLRRDSNIKFSISVTTRQMRDGEVNGKDYYFISDEEYNKLMKENAFYEHVDSNYGNRYGTLRSEVDSFINVGQDVLFDMDWIGMEQMKKNAPDDVVSIYLLPPSIKELRRRLEDRGTDSKEVIDKRMAKVEETIQHWNEFDYVVVNEDLEDTIVKVQRIISGERMKRVRQLTGLNELVDNLMSEFEKVEK